MIEPIRGSISTLPPARTCSSMRTALRDYPVYLAERLDHGDATLTFRMYERAAKRRERLTAEHLQVLDLDS